MTDGKAAAGIVSAVTAAAVFLLGLFWRWRQRRRDREALLASL
jgi:MYXO-CTERM domain-containing protein